MGRYMVNFESFYASMTEAAYIKSILSTGIVILAEFFGKDWWIIQVLFILIFVDFILGASYALKTRHQLSGMKLHDGVVKVMAYCIAIILVWVIQNIVLHTLPISIPLLAFFAGYQSLTEIKSIARHLDRLGIPMPILFRRMFVEIEGKMDETVEGISKVNTKHMQIMEDLKE